MEPKHSGFGIASFIISIVGGLSAAGILVLAVFLGLKEGGEMDEESPMMIVLGLGVIAMLGLLVIGLCLGIAGLVQTERKKLFAILGTTINALVLLGFGGLTLLGMMMG